ncbi:hypothetical protein PTTG_29253 [Puccinia triticina 1-1 BBBD Race 1]|uniref:Uncharacterized protein n=1 Tax=Puccinia triticina (isolate 1-1 / race 1 (BBBD)) TaxID=630390 RepID=A0A180G5H2_PUCT1|nr:hypothetical protein PTTG_29253 [Puccinia triticina 1-1 BBBD Race 1]
MDDSSSKEKLEQDQQRKLLKLQKQQEKEQAKLKRKLSAPSQSQRSKRATLSQSQRSSKSPSQSQPEEEDRGKLFVKRDYENICTYLKIQKNYDDLYGSGHQTLVDTHKMTKSQAFEVFAKQYQPAKDFESGTGAGIEEEYGPQTLAKKLEQMCPCYYQLDQILGKKPNVTSMHEYDHSQLKSSLQQPNEEDSNSEAELEEITYLGWEESLPSYNPQYQHLAGPQALEPADCQSMKSTPQQLRYAERQRSKSVVNISSGMGGGKPDDSSALFLAEKSGLPLRFTL